MMASHNMMENGQNADDILQKFLSPEEMAELCDYEKLRLCNLKDNYDVLLSLGFSPEMPEFMKPKKKRTMRPKPDVPPACTSNHQQSSPSVGLTDVDTNSSSEKKPQESRRKSRRSKSRRPLPSLVDSDSDSDDEWLPFTTLPRPKKRRRRWVPPINAPVPVMKPEKQTSAQLSDSPESSAKDQKLGGTDKQSTAEGSVNQQLPDGAAVTGQGGRPGSAGRYPRRNVLPVNYMEVEVPDDDEYILCEDCNEEYLGECPIHGPLQIIQDKDAKSRRIKTHAMQTLPDGLVIKESQIPSAGLGVFAERAFPKGCRFGPYKGVLSSDRTKAHNGYSWQIFKGSNQPRYLDASDPAKSNWTRYVNCARYEDEQNLVAFQFQGEIYYRSFKDIPAGHELLVWYGDEYGKELGIYKESIRGKIVKDGVDPNSLGWRCEFCHRLFSTEEYVWRHKRSKHGVPLPLEMYLKVMQNSVRQKLNKDASRRISGQKIHNKKEMSKQVDCNMLIPRAGMSSSTSQCEAWQNDENRKVDRLTAADCGDIEGRPHECDLCGNTFASASNLKAHRMRHTGGGQYKCNVCGKAFTQLCGLQTHRGIHTGDRPNRCDLCDKAFTQPGSLQKHRLTHTGDRPYRCDLCDKAFTLSCTLQRHRRTHTEERPHRCDLCGKAFTCSGTLQGHRRTHTGDRPYRCDLCDKAFNLSGNLQRHRRTHTGDKPYRCDLCDKAFSRSGNLQRHRRTHTGDKPYRCDLCNKAFTQLGHLQTHRRTHTGDKPYRCDLCGKAFTQPGPLQKHRRTHTGDRPYMCDLCDKAFTDLSNLQRHMRTHTGDRPYKCDLCSKAFTQSSSLHVHRKAVHQQSNPPQ